MKKNLLNSLEIITTLLCLILFLSITVAFTLHFRPLYYNSINRFHIKEETGLTKEIIKKNYDVLIDYNHQFGTKELEFPDFPMSEKGKIHFEEVKQIFVTIELMGIVSFFILICIIPFLIKKQHYHFLKWNFLLGISIPVILGVLIGLNWETAFVLFHKVFFNNDYWIFDITSDPIITILPDEFFFLCAVVILFLFLLLNIISGIVYRIIKTKESKKLLEIR